MRAAGQRREIAAEPGRRPGQLALERSAAIEHRQAETAQRRERWPAELEEALDGGHRLADQPIVALAPALVAAQRRERSRLETGRAGLLEHLGEGGHVEEAQVDPLAGERVDGMGRIPDQHRPLGAVLAGIEAAQRKGRPRPGAAHRPEPLPEGLAEAPREGLLVEGDQLGGLLGGGRPDDRAVPLGQRQEGQRPGGQEALAGALCVGALGEHRGHHRALPVGAGARAQAERLAHRRAGPVGPDHQRGAQPPAPELEHHPGGLHPQPAEARGAMPLDALERPDAGLEGTAQGGVLDDPAELGEPQVEGLEAQLSAPGALPDLHAPIRLDAPGRDQRPDPEGLEDPHRGRAQGAHPQVEAALGGARRRALGLDQRDPPAGLAERAGERRSDHPPADDGALVAHGASPVASRLRLP